MDIKIYLIPIKVYLIPKESYSKILYILIHLYIKPYIELDINVLNPINVIILINVLGGCMSG